jgi:hypothetical protein
MAKIEGWSISGTCKEAKTKKKPEATRKLRRDGRINTKTQTSNRQSARKFCQAEKISAIGEIDFPTPFHNSASQNVFRQTRKTKYCSQVNWKQLNKF